MKKNTQQLSDIELINLIMGKPNKEVKQINKVLTNNVIVDNKGNMYEITNKTDFEVIEDLSSKTKITIVITNLKGFRNDTVNRRNKEAKGNSSNVKGNTKPTKRPKATSNKRVK